ncbi:uncharacterized protein N7459_007256 [Penicillium hispanicum]|uniref:uncharacterized protein n=1 Tax=Penicillium hispanicum TaxID=1080232 RepID=UPI00253FE075|nr:uncharacterized protein N7459_007256 [Penicillium hispanicum]KAJ5578292.1 hypothetical protein N7459_007256 [Penicillium hispanicum]
MLTAAPAYTLPPCHLPFSPWTVYLTLGVTGLVSLCLLVAVQYTKRHYQHAYLTGGAHSDSWSQLSDMEKATPKSPANSTTPPGASACDVLQPLSSNGNFPSSGAVAARAREQMQNPASSPAAMGSPVATQTPSGSAGEANEPAVKRTESVQQMREVDDEGVRTWRRLIVEYR